LGTLQVVSNWQWIEQRVKGGTMKRELELLAPLVEELQQFCNALERNDAQAADRMIAGVEGIWPEVPSMKLETAEEDQPGPDAEARCELLAVVADVGYIAETLLAESHPNRTLAWCRANLITDLKHFKVANTRASL
jgi:hypothetical protein